MSILGFLVIAVSLVLYVLSKTRPNAPFANNWSGKKTILGIVIGIMTMSISGMFFYNPAGTATSVQYLWGGDEAVTSQGLKLKFWGKTIPISFEIAMQDYIVKKDEEGNVIKPPMEEGIYYRPAQRMEFADAIKADIATKLIVSVNYEDEETFLAMADKNRSEAKLVYGRIYAVYDQALKNTCKLMDAQDYISGASSTFDFYLKDQMENGMYKVVEDYSNIETSPIGGKDSTRTVAKGKIDNSKKQKRYVIARVNGQPVRVSSNSLKAYGLKIEQAAVSNVDWEEEFDKRLQLQKEQVAQTQLEKQEAEKEFYATKKAIAKGEREKAQVRVKLEKEQLTQTIAAETKALSAKYKEEEENNLLAAEKKRSQRIRVKADADAYEIRKKVSAGITPEKKLQMELDAEVAKEEARAKRAVPHTMIVTDGNGSKGGGVSDGTLLQMQLIDQMSKK